jgi:hypothetical protein
MLPAALRGPHTIQIVVGADEEREWLSATVAVCVGKKKEKCELGFRQSFVQENK